MWRLVSFSNRGWKSYEMERCECEPWIGSFAGEVIRTTVDSQFFAIQHSPLTTYDNRIWRHICSTTIKKTTKTPIVNNLAFTLGVLPYSSSPKSLTVARNNLVSGGGDVLVVSAELEVGLHILSFFLCLYRKSTFEICPSNVMMLLFFLTVDDD